MSKYNQAIDFCKALRDMLIVHFGDQSVMTQDCKIVFEAMMSMKTHIAELEYLVEAQKASNLKLVAALNESEAKLRELEALKADLKHTEECCVLWATDYGNALKEVKALRHLRAAKAQPEPATNWEEKCKYQTHRAEVWIKLYERDTHRLNEQIARLKGGAL